MSEAERVVEACPECDHHHIYTVQGDADAPAGYRCGNCGAEFDTPTERSQRTGADPGNHGLAQTLVEMDPEDVGPRAGGETDG